MVFRFGLIHINIFHGRQMRLLRGLSIFCIYELSQFDQCRILLIFINSGYLSDPVQRATLCKLPYSQKLLHWIIMVWFLDFDFFGILVFILFLAHYFIPLFKVCVSLSYHVFEEEAILCSILLNFSITRESVLSFLVLILPIIIWLGLAKGLK